ATQGPGGILNSTASRQITRTGAQANPAAFQCATFFRAIRASLGFNSTPITERKGNSDASSTARPIPAPISTNVNWSIAPAGFDLLHSAIISWNTEGAT